MIQRGRRIATTGTDAPPARMTVEKRCGLRRGADLIGNGERLVGAVEEFDGHEDHFLVAEIFEVVDLVLAGP